MQILNNFTTSEKHIDFLSEFSFCRSNIIVLCNVFETTCQSYIASFKIFIVSMSEIQGVLVLVFLVLQIGFFTLMVNSNSEIPFPWFETCKIRVQGRILNFTLFVKKDKKKYKLFHFDLQTPI